VGVNKKKGPTQTAPIDEKKKKKITPELAQKPSPKPGKQGAEETH